MTEKWKHLGSSTKVRLLIVYDIKSWALAYELQDKVIKKTGETEIVPTTANKIWGAILDNIQLISNYNKGAKLFLRATDIYCMYSWMVALQHKEDKTLVKILKLLRLQKEIKTSKVRRVNRLENQIYYELFNRPTNTFLDSSVTEMWSTENEGRSVNGEIFIRTLKNGIYNYMAIETGQEAELQILPLNI